MTNSEITEDDIECLYEIGDTGRGGILISDRVLLTQEVKIWYERAEQLKQKIITALRLLDRVEHQLKDTHYEEDSYPRELCGVCKFNGKLSSLLTQVKGEKK